MINPGDQVVVHIGDWALVTIIDKDEVQRLPTNPIFRGLLDSGALDLNKLTVAYIQGKISKDTLLDFYLNIGYSVCGFRELDFFDDLEIRNPLWD